MSEWKRVKLGEVSLGIYDGPHATPAPCETPGPYFLGIPQISPLGFIDMASPRYIAERDYSTWTRRVVPQYGDVVFSYEATLNLYALIPRDFRCCLGRRMGLVRPNPKKLDFQFLYYYFYSPEWRGTVRENTITGATVDRLSIAAFPSFKIALPPLAIQRRIAAILSDYDAAIANCRKQIALLEEAAMRLYREWFGDGKGKNWHEETAFDFCYIMSGGTPSTKHSEYYEGEIPFFTPADGHNVSCVLDTEKHLSSVGVSHCNSQLFPVGTIMVTARGTVGNVVYNAVPMAMNQSCYAIKPKDDCFCQLLLFVMLQNEMRQIKKAGSSGVFDAIKVETFKLLKLKVPNAELASHCLKVFQPMYSQVEKLSLQIRSLTEARDRLLPKLMKGEVEV